MIIILFICKSIWHFPVPGWMWVIAAFDGVASVHQKVNDAD